MKFEPLPYWDDIERKQTPQGAIGRASVWAAHIPTELIIDNRQPGYLAFWTGVLAENLHTMNLPSGMVPFVDLPDPRSGDTLKIHPLRLAVRIENNPIEVQWQWTADEGTQTAFLNVHTATGDQLIEARRVLDQFTEIMQQGRGGGRKPKFSKAKRRAIVEEWFRVEGIESQTKFVVRKEIDAKTLWRWIQDYKDGKI